jgi:exopolysaccharide biosynthesis polyprenyl glycosylphosphotransferase
MTSMLFQQQSEHFRRVTALLDMVLTSVTFIAAYWIRELWIGGTPSFLAYLGLLPIVPLLWVFLLAFFGAYREPRTQTPVRIVRSVATAVGVGMLVLFGIVFAVKLHDISRIVVFTFGFLNLCALVAVRGVYLWRRRRAGKLTQEPYRILIVGSGSRARRLASVLMRQPAGLSKIAGFLDVDPDRVGERILGVPVLGTIEEISGVLEGNVIDEVILAIPRGMIGDMEKVVEACEEEGIKYRLMADLFQVPVKRLSLDELDTMPLLTFDPVAQDEWKLLMKRAIDMVVAAVMLVVAAPLMLLVAMAVRMDSLGPIFFVQRRVGQNKRTFNLVKFRTMHSDAESRQKEIEYLNEADGPVFKMKNDPRVTRVGRVLRRLSIDELPQFWNVLKGDMSLVGPRPLPLRDVNLFDRGVQRKRFSVKPGLTCLWQISGRSTLPFSEWLRLDLEYIERWSIGLDLGILFRTVPAVLRGTGAK